MDVSFCGQVTRLVVVEELSQVGQARRASAALAAELGFDETDAGRVALAATELATNLLRHGGGGRLYLSAVQGDGCQGVELHTLDTGPGFDLAQCLPEGVSTAGSQGIGLGAIQRQATVLDAWSDSRGSVVMARIYPRLAGTHVDRAYGALRLAMRDEVACGDAWYIRWQTDRIVAGVIDGLGHGLPAADASLAGVEALANAPGGTIEAGLAAVHAGMSGTRGGAVAIAELTPDNLAFTGVGNISATLQEATGSRGLASFPGIVGVQYRRASTFRLHAGTGTLLVMHSDGLQSRWNLRDYPGLVHRHPALVVAVLQRDFDRGRDDACIVAIRAGVTG